MPKSLIFRFNGKDYALEPVKLDRKKLYGWTELLVFDENGDECKSASIDSTGTVVIPKGGLGMGILDNAGMWIEKSELTAVDKNGNPAKKIPSSFDSPVVLENTVSLEEFLNYNITSIYTMQGEENCPEFVKAVSSESVFTFSFNYRESYEGSTAFLIESKGELFVLAGEKNDFEFLGFDDAGFLDITDEETVDTGDDLDFSMM